MPAPRLLAAIGACALLAACAGPDLDERRLFLDDSGLPQYVRLSSGGTERITLLVRPVDGGRLTSRYGDLRNGGRRHRGLDFAAPTGTPVRAAGDGVVVEIGRLNGYGRYVKIRHGRTADTLYAHLSDFARGLQKGRPVRQGQMIGRVGTSGKVTGPHLHYEVRVTGRPVDPLGLPSAVYAQRRLPTS